MANEDREERCKGVGVGRRESARVNKVNLASKWLKLFEIEGKYETPNWFHSIACDPTQNSRPHKKISVGNEDV